MAENNKSNSKEQQRGNVQLPFVIRDQFIKDISFENPNYLIRYTEQKKFPEVSVNVETHVDKIADDNFEVSLLLSIKSQLEDKPVFVLDLTYVGVVTVAKGLERDVLEPVLLVHCPFLMFPFAREIISSVTRNGGYPPVVIEPIDFAALYMQKKQEIAQNDKKQNIEANKNINSQEGTKSN